jgi:hypothetical protein
VSSTDDSYSTDASSKASLLTKQQRNARIKHIEDLNERIQEAKQTKIITKNKYKKEDKLIVKFARNLKRCCHESTKNEIKILQLEKENEQIKAGWWNTRNEVNELKHIRIQITNKLQTKHVQHLEKERIRQTTIVDDQEQQLVKTNTDHQLGCHELCVTVLDANTELNRLRNILTTQLLEEEKEKQRVRDRYSKSGKRKRRRSMMLIMTMMVLLLAASIAAVAILSLPLEGTINIAVSLYVLVFHYQTVNCYYTMHIHTYLERNASDLIFHSKILTSYSHISFIFIFLLHLKKMLFHTV